MSVELTEDEQCDDLLDIIYQMLNSPSYDKPNSKTLQKVLEILQHADAYPDQS